ncbi:tRNA 2-thiouridine(34) synthase MnmA [Candidatus Woesebacteria bacterium]|nr:tRNA 2-thiouridine(34) synthase MnmA [Candidatus Woesebacteria bacterium]
MKVALGMSGGVDSSVSLVRLLEAGHDVTGVFLECWKAPGCRAEEDRKDALAVALRYNVPFKVLDFKDTYKNKVVEYFFKEYEAGRTPNPDVLCNKEIKFGLFYDWAMEQGFDAVATGHYAQITKSSDSAPQLCRSTDEHKDQTYFLYRLRNDQLSHILFPIGDLTKPEIRTLALEYELPVATKPDSQGICFIGEINVHQFLKDRLGEQPGDVVDTKGNTIGRHTGLWFYTIGQRHGFEYSVHSANQGVSKHAIPPFYVIAKNRELNQLIVGFGAETYQQQFCIDDLHWLTIPTTNVTVRIRHTGALLPCSFSMGDGKATITLDSAVQGIAPGQSVVFYQDTICLGGGVILETC